MSRTYCVYILASRSRTLYTGVTNNLERRLDEHREGTVPGFTSRYKIFRLVYCETFGDVNCAIAREKEIKGWRREKKIWLIQRNNRTWEDLSALSSVTGNGGEGSAVQRLNSRPKPSTIHNKKSQQQIPHRRSPTAGDRVRNDNAQP